MNITSIYPMRKRRSLDKTPGRSTSNANGGRLCTPRRITSKHSLLAEQGLDVVWDNNSPSPSRTLMLGKRKKHVGSDSSSSGGEISDLVKKLSDKTGQTPNTDSLLNYWLEEEVNQSETADDKHNIENIKSAKKRSQTKTPCRRPRHLRKCRRNKNKLSKELQILASMMQDNENIGSDSHPSTSINKTSTTSIGKYTILKPTNSDNPCKPCASSTVKENIDTRSSSIKTEVTSPLPSVDGFNDIDWEDDEGDVMLSQVDISALCNDGTEEQVFTNTQLFDVHEQSTHIPDQLSKSDNKDENRDANDLSFITESWEFNDDVDDEALVEVERKTQVVNNITFNSQSIDFKEQKNVLIEKVEVKPSNSKPSYSKEEIERKKLLAQKKLKDKQKPKPVTRQNTNRLKRTCR